MVKGWIAPAARAATLTLVEPVLSTPESRRRLVRGSMTGLLGGAILVWTFAAVYAAALFTSTRFDDDCFEAAPVGAVVQGVIALVGVACAAHGLRSVLSGHDWKFAVLVVAGLAVLWIATVSAIAAGTDAVLCPG